MHWKSPAASLPASNKTLPFEKYIQYLINRKIIPGVSILVGKGNSVVFKNQYGNKSLLPARQQLDENVIYDVASLTKPLITALLVVYLQQEQGLDLQSDIGRFFPQLKGGGISVQHLLTHTSGLTSWYPFYLFDKNYLDQFKKLVIGSKPGRKVVYSCAGYILLYHLIEKIAAMPFPQLAAQLIFQPLKLQKTGFCLRKDLMKVVAPTEAGNQFEKEMALKLFPAQASVFNWREYMICGETHDVNSFYLGGTAGNSGLFATAEELFTLSREFYPEHSSLLKPEYVRKFWQNFTPGRASHRSLGFKLNSSLITSGGRAISRQAIGHSGFTGTSIWLESLTGYTYIILTNRIHPVVSSVNFNRIRRRLHRLLANDLNLV